MMCNEKRTATGLRSWWSSAMVMLVALLLAAQAGALSVTGDVARAPGATVDPASRVRVDLRFAAGDTVRLAIRKSARQVVPGAAPSIQVQAGEATLRVLANDAQGSRLACVFGPHLLVEASDPAVRDNPLLKVMLDSRDGLRLVIAAGPRFTNPRVENIDEVMARFDGTLARALATLPPEIAKSVGELLRPAMTNRDAFALKLAEDLFVFLAPLGADLPLDGAVVGAVEIPALVGSVPMKAWNRAQVVAIDRAAQRVRMEYRQSTNKSDLLRASASLYERMQSAAPGIAVPPVLTGNTAGVHLEEWSVQDIDLATGWPLKSRRERLLEAGGQRSVEQVIVERQP